MSRTEIRATATRPRAERHGDFRARLPLRPSAAADEERDSEARDRGRDPDDRHLHAASRRPPDRRPRLPPTDEEQGDRTHDQGDLDPKDDVLPDDDEWDQRDERPQDGGDAHQDRTLAGLVFSTGARFSSWAIMSSNHALGFEGIFSTIPSG